MNPEKLSFEAIRPHLLHQFKNEDQLLKAVAEVGKLFNFYRENLEDYLKDEKLVSAYCAYYLTTNYPKLFETLKLLGDRFDIHSFDRVVDIGTGPGTFLLGLGEILNPDVELLGIDTSDIMLRQAKALLDGLCPDRVVDLGRFAKKKSEDESKRTLLMFTHSLNEMTREQGIEYADKVRPDSILLIEPGTKESFGKALELRQWALKNGYNVAYPCFSNANCPLDLEIDWCHQFVQVTHSGDVERMTQKLHRNRRLLPMVAQLYQKEPVQRSGKSRLIRTKKPTKHSLEWQLCEERGGENYVFDAEVPKRGMSKREFKDRGETLAGVEIDYTVEKEMQDKKRIKLV